MSKYSLGLDIGTNSIGWAVVDENNQLVKKMDSHFGELECSMMLQRLLNEEDLEVLEEE